MRESREKPVTMTIEEWQWVLDDLDSLNPELRDKIGDQLPPLTRCTADEEHEVWLTPVEAAQIGE